MYTAGGLEEIIPLHCYQSILQVFCDVAVCQTEGEKQDQVWQKVRHISHLANRCCPYTVVIS